MTSMYSISSGSFLCVELKLTQSENPIKNSYFLGIKPTKTTHTHFTPRRKGKGAPDRGGGVTHGCKRWTAARRMPPFWAGFWEENRLDRGKERIGSRGFEVAVGSGTEGVRNK